MSRTLIPAEVIRSSNDGVYYDQATFPVYAEEEGQSSEIRHASVSHWHEGIEMIHVLSGNMECCINDDVLHLMPGDFCFINRKQMHVASSGDAGDFRAHVVVFDPAMLTRNESVYNRLIAPVLEDEDFSHFHLSEAMGTAADPGQLIDEITTLCKDKHTGFELTLIGLLHLAFQKIHQAYLTGATEREPIDSDAAVQRRMSAFVYDHFAEKITLDDIAAAGSVSRSKCSKVFKKFMHKSPIDFLNLYRLEVAGRLLRNTDNSISTISSSCGFGQQSYFNRMFSRAYGCTPREYREQFARAQAS